MNPADKTLEWETTFALTVLKYETERGYRGNKPQPSYRHKAQLAKTRPAFTIKEYSRLYKAIRRWMHEEKVLEMVCSQSIVVQISGSIPWNGRGICMDGVRC